MSAVSDIRVWHKRPVALARKETDRGHEASSSISLAAFPISIAPIEFSKFLVLFDLDKRNLILSQLGVEVV